MLQFCKKIKKTTQVNNKMLKYFRRFLLLATMVFYLAKTTKEAVIMFVAILVIIWICFIIMNLFLLKTEINTPTNLFFILLIIVTITAYFLGKRYFENRK